MNYAVHSIMYFYYYLMAIKAKPKWFKSSWITIAQISQMIVGVGLTIAGCYIQYVLKPKNCYLKPENNWAALIMYGSYLFLFVQFFLQRYLQKGSKSARPGSSSPSKSANATTTNGYSNGQGSANGHSNGHSNGHAKRE
jgi:GNS1/SUR4 family